MGISGNPAGKDAEAPRVCDAPPPVSRAIVVLGGRVRLAGATRAIDERSALARRVAEAARAAAERPDAIVVASGGCVWQGVMEADAMAEALARAGVAPSRIVRERCSLSTRDNARYAARVLSRRRIDEATIVTCAWHLPRALALFAREGLRVDGRAPPAPRVPWSRAIWRWARERLAMRVDGVS